MKIAKHQNLPLFIDFLYLLLGMEDSGMNILNRQDPLPIQIDTGE